MANRRKEEEEASHTTSHTTSAVLTAMLPEIFCSLRPGATMHATLRSVCILYIYIYIYIYIIFSLQACMPRYLERNTPKR